MSGDEADGYIHILYYHEEAVMQEALDFVRTTYDGDAEEDEWEREEGIYHVIIFRTETRLSREQMASLLVATDPDEYDLSDSVLYEVDPGTYNNA
jgi:hypothetical protein